MLSGLCLGLGTAQGNQGMIKPLLVVSTAPWTGLGKAAGILLFQVPDILKMAKVWGVPGCGINHLQGNHGIMEWPALEGNSLIFCARFLFVAADRARSHGLGVQILIPRVVPPCSGIPAPSPRAPGSLGRGLCAAAPGFLPAQPGFGE